MLPLFLYLLGFLFVLSAEIEGNNRCEDGQELLATDGTLASQVAEEDGQQ